MKAHATLLQQPEAPATNAPAVPGESAPAARPPGLLTRLVARVRSWFEIPYGYQDENGFHYGRQSPPDGLIQNGAAVFTDRACDAMTYPMVLPKLTSDVPDQSPAPPAPAVPIAKD